MYIVYVDIAGRSRAMGRQTNASGEKQAIFWL